MKCMKEFDFEPLKEEKLRELANMKEMVLSTSCGDHVTSRVVSTAWHGDKMIFLSWGHHTKCAQIRANPMVALCLNQYQIEGIASIKGDVLDEKNSELALLYKEKQPRYFDIFSKYEGMQIIEVEIRSITCFGFDKNTYFVDRIDLVDKTAYRHALDQR